MQVVVLDLESYFADDFTLSKMTTEEYIRDPRFIAHGAAIKWSVNTAAQWYDEPRLRFVLKEHDWSDTFLISHHAQFDHLILSHHYDVHPKMSGCTLSMARLLLGNHLSVSLDAARKHFGIPLKTTPYNLFKNKHWHEMDAGTQRLIGEGACDEVESIWKIFGLLHQDFPAEEYEIVDSIIKMFSEPALIGDIDMLAKIWTDEAARKKANLEALNVAAADLASADRFAQLLRDEGIEPEMKDGKKKQIYAFAKTDQFMRDLLESNNDRIRTLAEARLGEKSTIMQTRAATYGWMARRGSLPVYLSYAGAGTLRVAGGDSSNFLNLKRKSPLRPALMAPKGFLLAPIDASQIECRCLHYLAGGPDEPVIQKFRNNEDPYVDLATQFYGEQIYKPKNNDPRKDEMEAKRGMGKQGRLMCLGPDTQVLTDKGVYPITAVLTTMRVWDGIEWVKHRGLVSRGVQDVVNIKGVRLTPDHPILCGPQKWLPAASLQNANILCRALASGSANLPLLDMNWALKAASFILWQNVHAERQNTPYILPILLKGAAHAAMLALKRLRDTGLKNIMDMLMFAPMTNIDAVCLDASVLFSQDAPAPRLETGTVMAAVESPFMARGLKAAKSSWPTSLNYRAGTIRSWNWIGPIMKKVMSPAIFNLAPKKKTPTTDALSQKCKSKLPTYDLAFAGPRNRFTIVSDAGPLIVHNCGYGAAGKQFRATAKNGQYGPPVDIPIDDAIKFVSMYRTTTRSVCAPQTGYWSICNFKMLPALANGHTAEFGPLTIKNHRMYMPNRAPMIYDTLEWHIPDADEECRDFERDGYWRLKTRHGWKKMWGAKLTQNICEAVSRVIVSQALIRIKRMGFRTLNWPYDELCLLMPDDSKAEENLQACIAEMKRTPDWLPGIPLDCEGSLGERYSK